MEKQLKKCKYCNETILEGRSDKKFCDEYCRYDYNNENGLRNQLYKFYLKYKEQLLIYTDAKIETLTSERDKYKRILAEADSDSYNGIHENRELSKIYKDLFQLEKMKKSILNDLALIKVD